MKNLKLLYIIAAITLLSGCEAQKSPAEKAAEQAYEQYLSDKAVLSLNNKTFALEANRVLFKYGNYINVNSNTNFVTLDGDKATIQLAFNTPLAGPNGIGGITIEGRASNFKQKTAKDDEIIFSMNVMGSALSASLTLRMYPNSNYCTATVYPTFSSNSITFSGYLYPIEDSSLFKGRAI